MANYVIVAGKTSSTFEDGVRRPSSAEFWGEIFNLPQERALALALAMAAEAGRLIRRDASQHIDALKLLVETYISKTDSRNEVDWDFIARRNMRDPTGWRHEDLARHERAKEALATSEYTA